MLEALRQSPALRLFLDQRLVKAPAERDGLGIAPLHPPDLFLQRLIDLGELLDLLLEKQKLPLRAAATGGGAESHQQGGHGDQR